MSAVLLALALAAPAAGDVVIGRFGTYTFARLGMKTVRLGGAQLAHGTSIPFVLPAGATEGPGHWYVLHLHAVVELDRSSPGTGYLSATSSGYGSAQITFKVARGKPLFWQAVGLLGGTESHTTERSRIELRFGNFLPYAALHPGHNALRISVEQFGGSPVRAVTIYDDSALEYTRIGPGKLLVQVERSRAVAHTGKRLVATVRVRNVGRRPVGKIRISTVPGAPDLRLVGPATRSRGTLRPGATLSESFAFVPQRARSFRVFFLVTSTANRPGAELNFAAVGAPTARTRAVEPQRPGSSGTPWWVGAVAAGGVLALLLGAIALWLRR